MSTRLPIKLLFALLVLGCAVLWLVSEMNLIDFKFTLGWAVLIGSAGCGSLLILFGLFSKTLVGNKKLAIYMGAGLFIVAFIALTGIIATPDNYVLPIIAIIAAAAIVLGLLATGGKKWDHADNRSVGYKTYRERKAEEEKRRRREGEE